MAAGPAVEGDVEAKLEGLAVLEGWEWERPVPDQKMRMLLAAFRETKHSSAARPPRHQARQG